MRKRLLRLVILIAILLIIFTSTVKAEDMLTWDSSRAIQNTINLTDETERLEINEDPIILEDEYVRIKVLGIFKTKDRIYEILEVTNLSTTMDIALDDLASFIINDLSMGTAHTDYSNVWFGPGETNEMHFDAMMDVIYAGLDFELLNNIQNISQTFSYQVRQSSSALRMAPYQNC